MIDYRCMFCIYKYAAQLMDIMVLFLKIKYSMWSNWFRIRMIKWSPYYIWIVFAHELQFLMSSHIYHGLLTTQINFQTCTADILNSFYGIILCKLWRKSITHSLFYTYMFFICDTANNVHIWGCLPSI